MGEGQSKAFEHWRKDEDVKACEICKSPFTMTRRRHHCRECGGILCERCSSFTKKVPEKGIHSKVRVCSSCYRQDGVMKSHMKQVAREQRERGDGPPVQHHDPNAAALPVGKVMVPSKVKQATPLSPGTPAPFEASPGSPTRGRGAPAAAATGRQQARPRGQRGKVRTPRRQRPDDSEPGSPTKTVDPAKASTVASMSTHYDAAAAAQLRQQVADRVTAAKSKFPFDQKDIVDYALALRATLKEVISGDIQSAAEKYALPQWMMRLPEIGQQLGLAYEDHHVVTSWYKARHVFDLLMGDGDRDKWIANMRSKVHESTSARMSVSNHTQDEVEAQVNHSMEEYLVRFRIDPKTDWVMHLYQNRVPVAFVIDMMFALFLYTVDMNEEGVAAIYPPANRAAHGTKGEVWAVANWALRVDADPSTPDDVRRDTSNTITLFAPFIEHLDCALECLPKRRSVVFRGVSMPLAKKYRLNTDVGLAPFTSTSLVGEEALNFIDPRTPGTFFIMRIHSAAHIGFSSFFPEEDEALIGRRSHFVVKYKTSRTVLRMLKCQFDIVTMIEAGGTVDNQAIVDALVGSAKHTVFIYKNYLKQYIESRVVQAPLFADQKPPPRPLLDCIGEWIRSGNGHLLLFGEGGTGKTSATLAVQSYLTGRDVFTEFVPLPNVPGGVMAPGALDRYLLQRLDLTAQQFDLLVSRYRVVLLLDSLDECGGIDAGNICSGILSLNPRAARCRIVLSCRLELVTACRVQNEAAILVKAGSGVMVASWVISGFNDQDVHRFVRNQNPDVSAVALLQKFPFSITRHPLRLQMLMEVFAMGGEDPYDQQTVEVSDVYESYINLRLGFAAESAGMDVIDLEQGLADIAWKMLRSGQWLVTVQEALEELGCEPEDLIELPVRVEDPNDPASPFTFWHRSIGEYLIAWEIVKSKTTPAKALKGVHSQRQIGVLRFLLNIGDDSSREDAVDQLLHHCGAPYEAIDYLKKELMDIEEKYGKMSRKCLSTLSYLGTAYGSIGQNGPKMALLKRALAIKEKEFTGEERWKLASTLNDLANAVGQMGNHQEKRDMLERSLRLKEEHYGKDNWNLATTLNNLGNACGELGDHAKKRDLLLRALKMKEEHYGAEDVQLASTLNNLGNAYGDLGDQNKKVEYLQRALRLKEAHYGPDHFENASTLNNLGNAYGMLGDQHKKIKFLERSLELKRRHYGTDNYNLASTYHNLGNAWGKLQEPAKKREYMKKALELKDAHYGKNHKECLGSMEGLLAAAEALKDTKLVNDLKPRIQRMKAK